MYFPCMCPKLLQSCPTLCNPMDNSLPSSSVYGILQARILEWVAMPFSRGSSQLMDGTRISYVSLPLVPPGKPQLYGIYNKKIKQKWFYHFSLIEHLFLFMIVQMKERI